MSSLASLISYFNFYYYIEGEELIIKSGLFQKKVINIPFDRIQSINFGQNLIHQFFNVVSLEIDTAGSASKEAQISALRKEEAHIIRDYILSQQPQLTQSATPSTDTPLVEEPTLLRLSITDLLKTGISQKPSARLRNSGCFGFRFTGSHRRYYR